MIVLVAGQQVTDVNVEVLRKYSTGNGHTLETLSRGEAGELETLSRGEAGDKDYD